MVSLFVHFKPYLTHFLPYLMQKHDLKPLWVKQFWGQSGGLHVPYKLFNVDSQNILKISEAPRSVRIRRLTTEYHEISPPRLFRCHNFQPMQWNVKGRISPCMFMQEY